MYTDVYKRVHCCIHTCTHLRSRYVPEERGIEIAKLLTMLVICASRGEPSRRSARGSRRLVSVRLVSPLLGDRGRCIAEYLVGREIKCTFALANSSKRVHVEAP